MTATGTSNKGRYLPLEEDHIAGFVGLDSLNSAAFCAWMQLQAGKRNISVEDFPKILEWGRPDKITFDEFQNLGKDGDDLEELGSFCRKLEQKLEVSKLQIGYRTTRDCANS